MVTTDQILQLAREILEHETVLASKKMELDNLLHMMQQQQQKKSKHTVSAAKTVKNLIKPAKKRKIGDGRRDPLTADELRTRVIAYLKKGPATMTHIHDHADVNCTRKRLTTILDALQKESLVTSEMSAYTSTGRGGLRRFWKLAT